MATDLSSLRGRTALISGGSRGIGLAIALALADAGASVALLAKTDTPDPRLPGTIHTAVAEIESRGGAALAVVGDVRNEDDVTRAVERTVERFGAVDLCVNNASAINLGGVTAIPPRRFDLVHAVNLRGTLLMIQACAPHLRASSHAHILTLSPPLNPDPRWLAEHAPYTVSKYGMTMLTLGAAAELRGGRVAANCLWPRTTIATAAVRNLLGGDERVARSRRPEIMADAAVRILARDPSTCTGNTFVDDDVLLSEGVTDLDAYAEVRGADLDLDLFVDSWPATDPARV